MGDISKFFDIKKDIDGNQLYWGAPSGLPYKGDQIELMKTEEVENMPIVCDAKAELLVIPEDLNRYNEIIDKCANGWWILRFEKFIEDKEAGKIRVFISWLDRYLKNSKGK